MPPPVPRDRFALLGIGFVEQGPVVSRAMVRSAWGDAGQAWGLDGEGAQGGVLAASFAHLGFEYLPRMTCPGCLHPGSTGMKDGKAKPPAAVSTTATANLTGRQPPPQSIPRHSRGDGPWPVYRGYGQVKGVTGRLWISRFASGPFARSRRYECRLRPEPRLEEHKLRREPGLEEWQVVGRARAAVRACSRSEASAQARARATPARTRTQGMAGSGGTGSRNELQRGRRPQSELGFHQPERPRRHPRLGELLHAQAVQGQRNPDSKSDRLRSGRGLKE